MPSEIEKWSPTQKAIYKTFLGSPLKLWASVGHGWIWHFDLAKYTEKQKPRVGGDSACCAGCCIWVCWAVLWPEEQHSCINTCCSTFLCWSLH